MVYGEAKRILTAYENKEGSVQSLINKSQCQHKNSLTCLIMKTLCYQKLLNKIIKKSNMLEKEKYLGDKLAQMLVYDVLFGLGVRGKFKGTAKRNYDSLVEALDYYMKKHQCDKREDLLRLYENFNQSSKINKPKYIYFNKLALNKKNILNRLKEDGFVRLNKSFDKSEYNNEKEKLKENGETSTSSSTNIDLINKIKKIKKNEFVKDNHIKSLYIFSSDSLINKTFSLFQEGHLLQIDKSSCLVPYALSPPEDSYVIDAASAPGNKTIMLSNIMRNTGLIYAFDIDETRVKLMSENLKQHHVKNVRLKCLDFLLSDPSKHERVTHILLDPSCSGSGMTNRIKFGDADREQQKDKKRLWNLEALQRRMIMHAMSFPSVEKIVYSTCSIHEEENENVVRFALDNCDGQFELVNIFEGKWNNGRGWCKNDDDLNKYKLNYCIRTSYEENLTNGFFVSCFQRKNHVDHESMKLDESQLN